MPKCFHEKPELGLSFHSYVSKYCICDIGNKKRGIDEYWINRYSEPYEKKPGHLETCVEYKNFCIHSSELEGPCGAEENCEFVRPSYMVCDKKCSNKEHKS